eukprot:CAMPEP_0196768252 /NCGR_PEP_ID=MMETSP1095-20130614/42521_1 /TAXON_ID=96789 ORGANISM="Chromulina nebulosa, Strain UTEXLB2642" /NCGR_SAMPLE_ID=MMETSP1095 /ASSEMBLY_ACC=CAM_ASM_000446 /LENGTH=144 /DNA_ID=CAMNT_0042137561 /DNA_START=897 /DNA_END=1331 /DNA_ORIENTATION=+
MALQMKLHEELSKIALIFQGKPKVLEYYIWIIEVLFAESKYGLNDIFDNDEELQYDIRRTLSATEKEQLAKLKQSTSNIIPKKKGKGAVVRPVDVVIEAVAMIGSNYGLETREREIALRLLYRWDDKSIEYKALVIRGSDLCDN